MSSLRSAFHPAIPEKRRSSFCGADRVGFATIGATASMAAATMWSTAASSSASFDAK